MNRNVNRAFVVTLSLLLCVSSWAANASRVKFSNGTVEGTYSRETGVRAFRGIPFARPPLGPWRWTAPQPVDSWKGLRQAVKFGPRCMQQPIFDDMNFRSDGVSEDCLYLNVWTPFKPAPKSLPVLVYFFGGGFIAGDGSEPRYEGESMAAKGMVAITVNYRLGVFGFFAHPALTAESPHHASGNYTFLDQQAALEWVRQNIAHFGGDPARVTIAGESAGSFAVSALMASPLSKDLIAGAIGESGAILSTFAPVPLSQVEEQGVKFAKSLGADSLAALRSLPAAQLLEAAGKQGAPSFGPSIDGYFFSETPLAIYEAGKQAQVPLLAGWNSEESNGRAVLRDEMPNRAGFEKALRTMYGTHADEVLKAYAPANDADALNAATDLASDRFIGQSTWKWIDLCARNGGKPVYRYLYSRPRPPMTKEMRNAAKGAEAKRASPAEGAVHSAEIEYAMGNLATNKVFAWAPDDYKVSKTMQEYFANFVKKGDPNGPELPEWPALNNSTAPRLMHIDVESKAEDDQHRDRHLVLDSLAAKP